MASSLMLRSSDRTTKTKAIGINCNNRLITKVTPSALGASDKGKAGKALLSFTELRTYTIVQIICQIAFAGDEQTGQRGSCHRIP